MVVPLTSAPPHDTTRLDGTSTSPLPPVSNGNGISSNGSMMSHAISSGGSSLTMTDVVSGGGGAPLSGLALGDFGPRSGKQGSERTKDATVVTVVARISEDSARGSSGGAATEEVVALQMEVARLKG